MPIALVAAGIGAAGAVASSAISAGANNNAANIAAQNNANNDALAQNEYNSTKALIQPYVDQGDTASTALQGFLGLGGDPAATQTAFNNYLDSTGYQFTKQQGVDAAEQSASAKGLLNSGAALKALDTYGTGLADQYGQQYVDNLNTVASRGASAVTALTGAGNTNVAAQTANNNLGTTAAGAAATANATATNSAINALTGATGQVLGASSFNGGGAANALTGGYPTTFNQTGYAPFGVG